MDIARAVSDVAFGLPAATNEAVALMRLAALLD